MGILDTQFIAARTDAENRGMKQYNQVYDINRFEFLEALVRVAGCKYKASGVVETYSEALRLII
mgnify:CR=1 FL=1